jgi:hypothetical protein
MTPLDFVVRIRPAGLDVPMADAPTLDGQKEGKGKLCPTVGRQLANGEGEGPRDLAVHAAAGTVEGLGAAHKSSMAVYW